jgi:hypothetical protein
MVGAVRYRSFALLEALQGNGCFGFDSLERHVGLVRLEVMNKRFEFDESSEDDFSSEEVAGILEELNAVLTDSTIVVYEEPTVAELEYIIAVAEDYSGVWYHSRVSLKEFEFVSDRHSFLREKLMLLAASHGIFISYIVDLVEQEEAELNDLLDSAFD